MRRRARSSLLSNAGGAVSSGEDWETKLLISLLGETHHGLDLRKGQTNRQNTTVVRVSAIFLPRNKWLIARLKLRGRASVKVQPLE